MRICLIMPGFSASADDWCIPALRQLVQQMARQNDVHVLSLRYPYHSSRYELFAAQVTALGGGQRTKLGSVAVWQDAWRVLAAEHRRRPFDVLHGWWANETGAVAAIAGRLLHVPTVVSLAGGELVGLRDIGYGGRLALGEHIKLWLALRLASAITAGSQSVLALAAPWLGSRPGAHALCLPLGVDTQMFTPGVLAAAVLPRLVHVASLTPVKDQATLLRAVAKVQQHGLSFVLDIAGSGPLQGELQSLAHSLGIGHAVHFLGEIAHDRLPAVYRRGSLFILSSRHEAQSMAVLEAAACGLPVVGTQVGVLPELAPQAAVAVPAGDVDALAEAIAGLLADPQRRSALGQAARARVLRDFDLESCTARFVHLYSVL